jgi:hypothetical protein
LFAASGASSLVLDAQLVRLFHLPMVGSQTILLLDVDFIVTEHLHEQLAGTAAAGALTEDLSQRRTAVVLPAFETSPQLSLPEGHSVALQATSRENT